MGISCKVCSALLTDVHYYSILLQAVYRCPYPLLNYFYPSEKIISKEHIGDRVKKDL